MTAGTRSKRARREALTAAALRKRRGRAYRQALTASALRQRVHGRPAPSAVTASALRERVHAPLVAALRQRAYGLTAASYDEMMHPRGKDGKWIERLGFVKISDFGDDRFDGHQGMVTEIVPNKKTGKADIKVEVFDDSGQRTGTEITLKPENVEQSAVKGRLNAGQFADPDYDERLNEVEAPSGEDERTNYQKLQDQIKARESEPTGFIKPVQPPRAANQRPTGRSSEESASRSIVWRNGSQVEAGDYVVRPSRGGKPGELTLVTDVRDTGDMRHLMLSDGGEVLTTRDSQLQVAVRNSKLNAEAGRGNGPRDFSHPGEPGYGEELPGFSEPESPYAPIDLRPPWDVEEAKRNIAEHNRQDTDVPETPRQGLPPQTPPPPQSSLTPTPEQRDLIAQIVEAWMENLQEDQDAGFDERADTDEMLEDNGPGAIEDLRSSHETLGMDAGNWRAIEEAVEGIVLGEPGYENYAEIFDTTPEELQAALAALGLTPEYWRGVRRGDQ